MCPIITFASYQEAIAAEYLLIEEQIPCLVVPLPPSLRAGCGIALRIFLEDVPRIQSLIAKQPWQVIYYTWEVSLAEWQVCAFVM
ncbi:uncharacterized protein DUF3343 [Heliophilum fasciatum]|uniref:Uncharacterized protein DUF3343 n=2 Tax=Heliophilum fasciatum TaxID=35700 RepID=A0A4R2RIU8_9FIRM|nr:uncharacterized protein DUF3343 [Heliophilum fasciatum]